MTLVLTQLNRHGIAMAADSAVTSTVPVPGGGTTHRVLHGVRKIQMITHLQAGIPCWLMGTINATPTDIWIQDFIARYQAATPDLPTFANLLAQELNNIFPPRSPNSGFHVAGYVTMPAGNQPAFYHVHNGASQYYPGINPDIFNANLDVPPQVYPPGLFRITSNGDYRLYAEFFGYLYTFFNNIPANPSLAGVQISSPDDLFTHAKLLRLQIQFVSGLYDVSNLVPGIGGPITILGIGPNGFEFFETR
jgi:hypothetical protein